MTLTNGKTPLAEVVAEFCGVIQLRSNGTPKAAQTDVQRLLAAAALMGVEFAEEITPTTIARVMAAKEEESRSPKTINQYKEIIHRLCSYLLLDCDIQFDRTGYTNPGTLVRRRKEEAPDPRFLEMPELERLLDGVSDQPKIRVAVAIMAFAGLRRGEVLWLTKSDVDLGRGCILVRAKTVDDKSWQPKTGRNRNVPISSRLEEELCRWESPEGTPWFLPSPRGERWDESNFSSALRRAQVPMFTFWGCLDLRHTFGTMRARKGVSLYKIAVLMGNSPEIARRHYAVLRAEDLREDVEL